MTGQHRRRRPDPVLTFWDGLVYWPRVALRPLVWAVENPDVLFKRLAAWVWRTPTSGLWVAGVNVLGLLAGLTLLGLGIALQDVWMAVSGYLGALFATACWRWRLQRERANRLATRVRRLEEELAPLHEAQFAAFLADHQRAAGEALGRAFDAQFPWTLTPEEDPADLTPSAPGLTRLNERATVVPMIRYGMLQGLLDPNPRHIDGRDA